MKLSDGEKLILLMLSDLYEKLGIVGEIDPEFIKRAIFDNQLWGINWKYSGIPFEETKDPDVVKEVVDILDMWQFIEGAYSRLTEEEKNKLAVDKEPLGKDPKFKGFDGNQETEYITAAMFLVNELDRFQIFKGRSFDSQPHSIGMHKRMLNAFKPIRRTLTEPMSLEQLITVLREQIHPEHRK